MPSKKYPTITLSKVPERPKEARTGSQIVEQLIREKTGYLNKREDVLLEEYLSGNIPNFMRTLCPVPVTDKDSTLVVYCLPDYLCLGSDEDFIHTPMSPILTQKLATEWGMQIPTQELVNVTRVESQVKLNFRAMAPDIGYPYDSSMMYTERWPIHTGWFKTDFVHANGRLGQLTTGHKKDIIVHPWLIQDHYAHCGIHGAFYGNDKPIHVFEERPRAHEVTYKDYSHGSRLYWPIIYVVNDGGQAKPDKTIADWVMSDHPLPLSEHLFSSAPTYPV